jgi:hypothetical protein
MGPQAPNAPKATPDENLPSSESLGLEIKGPSKYRLGAYFWKSSFRTTELSLPRRREVAQRRDAPVPELSITIELRDHN